MLYRLTFTLLAASPCGYTASLFGAPPLEYARSDNFRGISINSPAEVSPAALVRAREIIEEMLQGRSDIRDRLVAGKAALAIIPRKAFITALPEFVRLIGTKDPNGNAYDSFAVRGAGGIRRQPVTATAEENLLKLSGDPFGGESITHHEFAHAIMNLGFTSEDRKKWMAIFQAAVAKKLFPGAFAMTNADEYWAELSQSYFSVNNEINGPALIGKNDPDAAAFLTSIYGPSRISRSKQ